MRYLCWKARLFADANRLADAIEYTRPFVAHVRDVHAAQLTNDLGNLNHFLSRRVISRNVKQARREAEGSVQHRSARQISHALQFFRSGLAIHQPHCHRANGPVAYKPANVNNWIRRSHLIHRGPQRQWRAAILTIDHKRDSLPHDVL